ncbi:class I SAM-dependent methyltransferase [Streptomyces sp. MS1.AVA.3]|uniref:class I SAM-dependent methyltransferase n=1 Tax=Streptomyces decoyicus TaxID=249567 RepID=UPI0030BEA20F
MTRSAPDSRDDEGGYLLDNAQPEAGTRFDALSELFDPTTFRHIEGLGIAAGWQCWEIGAGGPSVVTWPADRVGQTGRVLATDIDTSWASQAAGGVIEVLRHDVSQDEPPGSGFDFVHGRLVLVHVADRERALRAMVGALVTAGLATDEEIDRHLANVTSGRLDLATSPMISAWGRRP